MCIELKQPVSSAWLAERLGVPLMGPESTIGRLCNLGCLAPDGLAFALPEVTVPELRGGTIVALAVAAGRGASVLASETPRLDFIRAQHLVEEAGGFVRPDGPPCVDPSSRIEAGAVVEDGVTIGAHTRIGANAVILRGSRIGSHCDIQCGAVIGDAGFGFERDEQMHPLRMIHLGGVRIGDHVEIGVHASIARGALGDTVIEDHVKINNLVHIAHNCHIGEGTLIGACADLCGSIHVGRCCWIAPNASIRQKLRIGDEAIIGIGAVVVKDVERGATVYGNPARPHTDGKQARRMRGLPRVEEVAYRPLRQPAPQPAASSAAAE